MKKISKSSKDLNFKFFHYHYTIPGSAQQNFQYERKFVKCKSSRFTEMIPSSFMRILILTVISTKPKNLVKIECPGKHVFWNKVFRELLNLLSYLTTRHSEHCASVFAFFFCYTFHNSEGPLCTSTSGEAAMHTNHKLMIIFTNISDQQEAYRPFIKVTIFYHWFFHDLLEEDNSVARIHVIRQ